MTFWQRLRACLGRPTDDPALTLLAPKFGTKPIRPEWQHYDESLAIAGSKRARTQTETGRPIPKLKAKAAKRRAEVTSITSRKRA